jgi:hypothetical protein
LGQIATDLSAELDVPFATVLADTVVVIGELGDQGLLAGVDPDPATGASRG